MEFLLVRFSGYLRTVIVDGKSQGLTNTILELEKGHHSVRLKGPPFDFKPSEVTIVLEGTTSLTPQEVTFEKL